MSRGLTTRLRKLKGKAGTDGGLDARLKTMMDQELFVCCRDVSEQIVASYGGLEEAVVVEGVGIRSMVLKALSSATASEFLGYADGWERYVHERPSGGR